MKVGQMLTDPAVHANHAAFDARTKRHDVEHVLERVVSGLRVTILDLLKEAIFDVDARGLVIASQKCDMVGV